MQSRYGLFILLLVLFVFAACGSDDDPAGPGTSDDTAPARVSDLQIQSYGENSASVTWTAPGDDATEGTAAGYEIGYAGSPITETNWPACTRLDARPTPTPAGSEQSVNIPNPPTPDLYVALMAVDEAGNWSGLSNIAHGHIAGNFDVVQLTFEGSNREPCLDDGFVTWVGQHDGIAQEIWIAGIGGVAATPNRLTDNAGQKMHPSSHGSEKIVWMGRERDGADWEIWVYSKYSIPRFSAFTDDEFDDIYPVLAGGGDFAWLSGPTVQAQIRYFDGHTHDQFPISEGCCPVSAYSNSQPYADDGTVVWTAYERGTGDPTRILMWRGHVDDVTDEIGHGAHDFSVDDGKFAYEWSAQPGSIRYWDGVNAVDLGAGWDPSLDDGWIAFEGWDGHDYEIMLWDGVNILQITDNDYQDYDPSLSGDRLAWSGRPSGDGGAYQIFYTRLPDR